MSTTAQQRREALAFWHKHGLAAAMDHAGVCRSTLHAWQAAYRERGIAGLSSKRRAPKQTRRRNWPPALLAEMRRLPSRRVGVNIPYRQNHSHLAYNPVRPATNVAFSCCNNSPIR